MKLKSSVIVADVKRDPYGIAKHAGSEVNIRAKVRSHEVGMILGSGFEDFASALGQPSFEAPADEFSGFLPSGVEGHTGRIQSIEFRSIRVLVLPRKHFYELDENGENLHVSSTVHPVRTALAAGCRIIILTNAVGGLRPEWPNGKVVLTKDAFTRFVPSPIFGPNFVQCHELFSKRLLRLCKDVGLDLEASNYIQVAGPHFETPFEAWLFGHVELGHIGMSLGTEAVVAADPEASPTKQPAETVAFSVISDLAGEPTSHKDVLKVVRAAVQPLAPKIPLFVERCLEGIQVS